MTDKQINIVEILAEQCKNCTLYEGDTVSLNISIFDRQLKGVCFNNNIYFSVDELNYIMQKLISKEQECDVLRKLAETHLAETINMQRELDQLTEELAISIQENEEGREINAELKADNDKYSLFIEKLCDYAGLECDSEEQAMRTLSDLASQMNKARWIIDKLKQTLTEIKQLLEDALDTDKTNAEQSFDNIHKAIKLCEVLDEN